MRPTAKHPDLIYDLGMQQGEDTDFYLRKGFRVVGFEADPDLAAHCRRRFASEIASGRLVIVEGAVVDDPGTPTIRFYKNRDTSQWGTVVSSWAERNEVLGTSSEVIEVRALDFVACLAQHGVPHFMKIDIEGMDMACVRALAHFQERPDYVSIESEKLDFAKLKGELDTFRSLGYTGFQAVQQNGVPAQAEPRPAREGRFADHRFPEGASGLFGADLPGRWKDYEGIFAEYRFIFLQYRLWGDYGWFRKYLVGKVLRRLLAMVLRKPVPGWYDTHARHASAHAAQ